MFSYLDTPNSTPTAVLRAAEEDEDPEDSSEEAEQDQPSDTTGVGSELDSFLTRASHRHHQHTLYAILSQIQFGPTQATRLSESCVPERAR
jgi:hypothetical protein